MPEIPLDRFTWVDAQGIEHTLADPRIYSDDSRTQAIVTARQGFGMPPITYAEQIRPGLPGARRRSTMVGPRDLALKVTMIGTDRWALRQLERSWDAWFLSDDGMPGQLKVYGYDGVRVINASYMSGLERSDWTKGAMRSFVLALRAHDPYWYAGAPVQFGPYIPVVAATPFFPIPPVHLGRVGVASQDTAVNIGDAEAYPVWTATGPGGPLTITNNTTGQYLRIETVLDQSTSITIDTNPAVGTVLDNGGDNVYGSLTTGSSLWALQPGVNQISVDFVAAVFPGNVQGSYTPRYRSA